jgi:endonuclease III
MLKQERFKAFVEYFTTHQPNAETELNYTNPYELLVAVILSAQCTDKRINQITPALFEKYPNAFALAQATVEEIFEYIRTVSYPNNKAKHLAGMARLLVEKFNGEVPSSMDDLQSLPGVGRKTANVITSIVFEAPALAVDTHVFRVANRLGLTRNATTPLAVERQLIKYIPTDLIRHSHHWLILHGRYICQARRPKCEICPITHFCKYYAYQQTATALTKAAAAERKKERALAQRRKANKLSTALKKFEVKE